MEIQVIQSKIYEIRGVRVMLDRDLAELYQVETRTLKQAVRRNIERFPEDFMMRLSAVEANKLIDIGRSQNVIPQDTISVPRKYLHLLRKGSQCFPVFCAARQQCR